MLFSLSMFPVGTSDSLQEPVAVVIEEIDRAGLEYQTTGMNTVIEGEWDAVLPVIRAAHRKLAAEYDRVYLSLSVDDHPGSENRLTGAVEDVQRELGRPVAS
ncbi:MAG: MTH1187 family thiamine-binding protein [Gemmatimonadetes bacterium]|nr:MTH1187 family thiamine-binding protein [Gemmatimonadota bacterium]NIV82035.1 MTH1187 family thiamine-binding protein [Gemmatimonadota bacterium]NIY38737.1 MTH1187 family thiamine-binding protein [Gemmatimonadota bacterium]